MFRPDYKAITYLLFGIILGCAGDDFISTLAARL